MLTMVQLCGPPSAFRKLLLLDLIAEQNTSGFIMCYVSCLYRSHSGAKESLGSLHCLRYWCLRKIFASGKPHPLLVYQNERMLAEALRIFVDELQGQFSVPFCSREIEVRLKPTVASAAPGMEHYEYNIRVHPPPSRHRPCPMQSARKFLE